MTTYRENDLKIKKKRLNFQVFDYFLLLKVVFDV